MPFCPLMMHGYTSMISTCLQRETTIVTSCLLPWIEKLFHTESTFKGKDLLQYPPILFLSELTAIVEVGKNENAKVVFPEVYP